MVECAKRLECGSVLPLWYFSKAAAHCSTPNASRIYGLFIILLVMPFHLFALAEVSVNASLDSTSLHQGWPIKGSLEITHEDSQKVDENSATIDGKPLKISLLRNVKISPENPLTVSIYHFSLQSQNKGSYVLSPISIKIGDKTYKTLSIPYEVQGPIAAAPMAPGSTEESSLKLKAFIVGPKELYPGQKTRLTYRYIYHGNIALSKEVLPMLDATGLQKVGRTDIKNYTEGDASIFEVSQEVEAIKPGTYSWGPSTIEGVVYVEDSLGNRQFTATKLVSEAPSVELIVSPFPSKGKPASFNGAFGEFTFNVALTSPSKISVGDPINLDVAISGSTTNWDQVSMPELCCQPGFGGFFKLSDLPPIGKVNANSKHFTVTMNPLSSAIKNIPAIQFSYFDPDKNQYKTLNSNPIGIEVSPAQEIPTPTQKTVTEQKPTELILDWMHIYRKMNKLEKILPLQGADLKNEPFGKWWVLWMIPLSIILWLAQFKLKQILKKRENHD